MSLYAGGLEVRTRRRQGRARRAISQWDARRGAVFATPVVRETRHVDAVHARHVDAVHTRHVDAG